MIMSREKLLWMAYLTKNDYGAAESAAACQITPAVNEGGAKG
jgi:hypothetical protein